MEDDTARKQPPKEEHLTNREQTIDLADTVGLVNDATRFDADVTDHMDEFQQGTADPLPYAGGHWQADAALGGDANYEDNNQPFEVDEQHHTSTTHEKKHFKSEEVDSPEVTPLTEFLTTPSQKKVDNEAQKKVDNEDNEVVCDVWERNKTSLTAGFGVYSIAEVWEWQSHLNRKPDNYNCKFHEAPLLNKLVDTFTEMLQYLTIDMMWVIVKSKPGSGFQTWHQDFNLSEKITKTIVINLGAVKRSDLLGGPLRKVVNSENKDNEAKLSARDILGGHMLCGFINSESKDNEGKVRAMKGKETEQRDDAMAKRNCKQQSQAKKANEIVWTCSAGGRSWNWCCGITKVYYCTHSHAQGLLAIVYEMKEDTGGILVCCEHGVITHDGSRKDYWVPYDKYDIKARAQDTCPIEEALQSVRNLVLEG